MARPLTLLVAFGVVFGAACGSDGPAPLSDAAERTLDGYSEPDWWNLCDGLAELEQDSDESRRELIDAQFEESNANDVEQIEVIATERCADYLAVTEADSVLDRLSNEDGQDACEYSWNYGTDDFLSDHLDDTFSPAVANDIDSHFLERCTEHVAP